MSTTDIKVRIGLDGVQQVQTGAAQAAQAVQGLNIGTKTLGQNAQLTGHQTAQLSAQLQDFFIQVQAGQSPLTAFAQQGSQLSAVFGGFGNAARAVGSLITPLVGTLGAAAAVVGTVGYAYLAAAREQEAFRRSIALTGNAAGVTASQLNELAKSAVVGSRGTNADTLAQLVATGQVAASVLAKASEAAIRLERDGGVSIKETVDAFSDLGKAPLDALRKLNETQNFLTVSTYKQVAALQDQGKLTEAAKVAQEAYASAGISRGKDLEAQLGSLDRAWRDVAKSTQDALNAVRSIGKADTVGEAIQAQTEKATRLRLAIKNQGIANLGEFLRDIFGGQSLQQQLDSAQAVLDQLKLGAETSQRLAQAERDRSVAAKAGVKAVDEQREALKKAREEAERLAASMATAGRELIDSLASQEVGLAPDFLKKWNELNAALRANPKLVDQVREAQAALLAQQPREVEAVKKAEEAAKTRNELRRAEEKAINDYLQQAERERQAALASVEGRVQGLVDEAEAVELARAKNLSLAEAVELVALARLREKQARYTEGSEPYLAVEREIEARERLITLLGGKAARESNQRAADEAARQWERTAEQIGQSLSDALMQGGMSAAEYIRGVFRSMVLRPIIQGVVQNGVNGALQLASSATGGALQTAGNVGSAYSGVNGAYSLYGSAAPAANYAAVYSGQAYGTGFASQQSAMLAAQEAGMVSQAGGASSVSAAGWAGYAALAVLAAMQGSSDYSAGFRRQQSADSGTVLGDASAKTADLFSKAGVSDRIADLISGATLTARLFGRAAGRVEATGLQGSIGGGDFTGTAFADIVEKGGLFRSDKRYTETSALSEALGKYLDAASAGVLDKAKQFGAALGLPVQALASVTQDIKVTLTDDAAKNQEEIVKALSGYGDALVKGYADAVAPLARYGETTAQTLERVGQSIVGVNEVLQVLGLTALQTSIDGGKAAVTLADLFGGVAGLQQSAGTYLAAFYSDAERSTLALAGIGRTLADVGVSVPATRDAFRGLVEAQDLTTDSGRQAFTALMAVAGAFADVVPAARSAADILAERARLETELLQAQGDTAALRARERADLDATNQALYDQIRALEDQRTATDAAREAADKAAQAAQQLAAAWDGSVSSAAEGVRAAYAVVASTIQSAQQAAQAAADQSIQQLRSTSDQQLRTLEGQAQQIERTFGSLLDSMKNNIQALSGDLSGDGGRSAALSTLRDAQRALRSGGAVDVDAVRNAAGIASRVDSSGFATRLGFVREQAGTLNLLRDVSRTARAQMTAQLGGIAAQQVAIEKARDAQVSAIEKARDAELSALAKQLEEARSAASSLVSIDDGIQTVGQALTRLESAMGALKLLNGTGGPTGQILQSGSQLVYGSTTGAVVTRQMGAGWDGTIVRGTSGATATADVIRKAVGELIAAENWARIVQVALAEGIDSNTLDGIMDWKAGTAAVAARLRGLPAFATGTAWVPSTGPAIVHQGERILPAADNAALMHMMSGRSSDELADLLRAMLAALDRLHNGAMDGLHANASATGATARLLTDVIKGGASIATRAEA